MKEFEQENGHASNIVHGAKSCTSIPFYQCCSEQHNQHRTSYADQPKIPPHPMISAVSHSAQR